MELYQAVAEPWPRLEKAQLDTFPLMMIQVQVGWGFEQLCLVAGGLEIKDL